MGDLYNEIQEQLRKIKEKEEEHKKKMEKENRKKELAKQIQDEIQKINSIHGTDAKLEDLDKEEVPTWVKMVQDAQARKEYLLQKQKSSEKAQTENENEDAKKKVLDIDLEG